MNNEDFVSFQKQTCLNDAPQSVRDEYEMRAAMLARAGKLKPLGPAVMCDIIRHCGIDCPLEKPAIDQENINWDAVPKQTRIIVMRDPTRPRRGVFLQSKLNGCLDVMFDGEATVHEFGTRWCTIEELVVNDPWSNVQAKQLVAVTRGARDFEAEFVRVEDTDMLRVKFKSGERVVPRSDVKLVA